jgi:diadenosine tetraphosphatase ApaH/serine/threonine PP2A family protein phosphatase
MKYAIFGDIHSNLEALNAVLEAARAESVERFLCLGDIVGYNANPRECVKMVRDLECEMVVKGNHDYQATVGEDLRGFNPHAAIAIAWTREQLNEDEREWLKALPYQSVVSSKATLVHATLDNPDSWGYIFDRFTAGACISYQFTPLCFYGHTHIPLVFEKFGDVHDGGRYERVDIKPGHKYLFNAGSVGQPRDGDPRASLVVYDTDQQHVTLKRVEYDIAQAQDKIRKAGLPERLARRLGRGR